MKRTTRYLAALMAAAVLAIAPAAAAWKFTGGPIWKKRVGPGVHGIIGGNICTDGLCDHHAWDSHFGGSIGGTGGFFYRVIPNLVLLGEAHLGYINTNIRNQDDDGGMLFQATFAAELHVPATDWLDPYLGFGMGYAYLGLWTDTDGVHTDWTHYPYPSDGHDRGHDYRLGLHGVNFEWRTGCDFYPFSRVPTLGLGPQFRLGMTYWPTACVDSGDFDECDGTEGENWHDDDLPFLFFFGGAAKYGF